MNRYDTIRQNAERQAQFLIDRQVPADDPPCFADWYESEAGKEWRYQNSERLFIGKPIYESESFAVDRLAVLERIKHLAFDDFGSLPDADKDAVNCWHEWADAEMAARITGSADDAFLAGRYYKALEKHIERIADDMVDAIAPEYFNKYIGR